MENTGDSDRENDPRTSKRNIKKGRVE
jgi:hypothetical protein